MFLQINPSSGVPIYRQIIDQVKHNIATGRICPGDRLPSVRELATQLHVNPNTIAKAYVELERQVIVITRQGLGTFVSESVLPITKSERQRKARALIDQLLVELTQLNLSRSEVQALFNKEIKRFRFQPHTTPVSTESLRD